MKTVRDKMYKTHHRENLVHCLELHWDTTALGHWEQKFHVERRSRRALPVRCTQRWKTWCSPRKVWHWTRKCHDLLYVLSQSLLMSRKGGKNLHQTNTQNSCLWNAAVQLHIFKASKIISKELQADECCTYLASFYSWLPRQLRYEIMTALEEWDFFISSFKLFTSLLPSLNWNVLVSS